MKNTLNLTDIVRATLSPRFTGEVFLTVDKYGVEITAKKPKKDIYRLILPHKNIVPSIDGNFLQVLLPGKYSIYFKRGECTALIVTK